MEKRKSTKKTKKTEKMLMEQRIHLPNLFVRLIKTYFLFVNSLHAAKLFSRSPWIRRFLVLQLLSFLYTRWAVAHFFQNGDLLHIQAP